MADRHCESIKVKVFGEKKGRYNLDNLPKLKYKKKDKPRRKGGSKVSGSTSFLDDGSQQPSDAIDLGLDRPSSSEICEDTVYSYPNSKTADTEIPQVR